MKIATRTSGPAREPEFRELLLSLGRSRLLRRVLVVLSLLLVCAGVFYREENRRGKRVWEQYHRQLAARGVELDWHKLAPPPVPDGDNLAMTPFLAPLYDYVPGTYTPRDLTAYNRVAGFAITEPPYAEARRTTEPVPAMVQGRSTDLAKGLRLLRKAKGQAGSATQAEEPSDRRAEASALLEALGEFQPVLAELQAASARPEARFNLNYKEDYSWRLSQPHLPVLKRVSRLLMWRASASLALQNTAAAAGDVALILALAQAIGREPFASSFLARNVILDDALQIIWEGLADRRWSDAQLSEFEARLQEPTLHDFRAQLALERAAINSVFEWVHKEPAIVKGWDFGPGFWEKARGFILRHMPAGWMYLEQVSYHRAFDVAVVPAFDPDAGRLRPRMVEQAAHPAFPLWGHRLLAGPVLNSARFLMTRAALTQTGVDQAVLACALKRYRLANNQFPERLEELAPRFLAAIPGDVITGKPMKYRRTPDGQFLLYSIGVNEKDDGGKVVLNPQTKASDPAQGDWVWPNYPAG
jgi:hypothetical protein